METLRALVVEDEPSTRMLYDVVLRGRGCTVTTFESADDAWAACQRRSFDMALLDCVTPGTIDGLELCRRIRGTEWGPVAVIVIATGHIGPDRVREVLGAGADDYLQKPFGQRILEVRLALAERLVFERRERALLVERVNRIGRD